MVFPRLEAYQQAVQNPHIVFSDPVLRLCRVASDPFGMPLPISGGFAVTYHFIGSGEWAVRCFSRDIPDLESRYAALTGFLRPRMSRRFVTFEFEPKGILVDGQRYPIVKMEWVKGPTLGNYINAHLSRDELAWLAGDFRKLIMEMESLGIAHGDLQEGNILVEECLRLIDYDGMYVPGMKFGPSGAGHRDYQHPRIKEPRFGADCDSFAAIVIYLGLLAVSRCPDLWRRYDNGHNILFKASDFQDPSRSSLLRDMNEIPELRPLVDRLKFILSDDCTAIPRLEDFLTGRLTTGTTLLGPAKGSRELTSPYPVICSSDRQSVESHIGNLVQVIGTVAQQILSFTSGARYPYVILHFDRPWPNPSVRVIIWGDSGDSTLHERFSSNNVEGCKVTVTGILRELRRYGIPEIRLDNARSVRTISSSEYEELMMLASRYSSRTAVPSSRSRVSDTATREGTVLTPAASSGSAVCVPRSNKDLAAALLGGQSTPKTQQRASTAPTPRQTVLRPPISPAASQPQKSTPSSTSGYGTARTSSRLCFVATAVFGADAPETEVLRNYRDAVLLTTPIGRMGVAAYYKLGPRLATYVSRYPILKRAVALVLRAIVSRLQDSTARPDGVREVADRHGLMVVNDPCRNGRGRDDRHRR